jgi:glycosyltransferase involved in cell wall biosynthesis
MDAVVSKSPVVSVLMTCYNREKYIAEAIESVLSSAFKDFELIISDDNSKDRSLEIATTYAAKDSRIRVYHNTENHGDYPHRNKIASYARGEFIMFCDSDDKFYPESIGYCVHAMRKFPEASIGMCYLSNDRGEEPFVMGSAEAIGQHFFSRPFLTIGPGGTIIRKAFFNKIGGYPEKYGPANDMYFNLKAASASPVVLLPWIFLYYRIHAEQEQNNVYGYMHFNYRYQADALKELELHITGKEKRRLDLKNKRRFAVNFLRTFFIHGRPKKALSLWPKAQFTIQDFLLGIFHF